MLRGLCWVRWANITRVLWAVYTRSVVNFMWLGFVLTNLVVGSHGCFVRVGCGVSLTPLVQLHNALSDRYGLATEQISKEISGCQDPVKILRCCPSATLAKFCRGSTPG